MIRLPKRFAVTFTGGIDSTVLAYMLVKQARPESEVHLVSCNYGQANWKNTFELRDMHEAVLHNMLDLKKGFLVVHTQRIQLPAYTTCNTALFGVGYVPEVENRVVDYSKQEMSYEKELIPYRNAFLFLNMMAYCRVHDLQFLYTGHQYQDGEWDNIESFRHRTEDFGAYFIDRINLLGEVGTDKYIRVVAPFLEQRADKRAICELGMLMGIDLAKDTYSCQYSPRCNKCDNCICRENVFKELGIKDV